MVQVVMMKVMTILTLKLFLMTGLEVSHYWIERFWQYSIKATAAVLEAAWITGFNEKNIRYYRKEFMVNKGKFKEEKRGKHKRVCLFNDEDLLLQASMWVIENVVSKGGPNMTARAFCQWVNDTILPSRNFPPFFPRSISVITATRWLHHLGYRLKSHKKGTYVDGHEREDVVEYRSKYLNMMKRYYDTHLPPPPPKFHCELNPIERVWGQAESTRGHTQTSQ